MFCYPSDILGHSVCGAASSPLSVPTGKSSTLVTVPDGLFDAPRDDQTTNIISHSEWLKTREHSNWFYQKQSAVVHPVFLEDSCPTHGVN